MVIHKGNLTNDCQIFCLLTVEETALVCLKHIIFRDVAVDQ